MIGTKIATFTAVVPSSVVPELKAIVTDLNGFRSTYGSYLVGKSRYKISMTETIAYGSVIKSRIIKMNGETFTSKDPISSLLRSTSYNSVSITITDGRGREATYSITNLPTRAYAPPKITSFTTPVRCTDAGIADKDGDYIKTTLNYTYDAFTENTAVATIKVIREIDDVVISTMEAKSGEECILPAAHGYSYIIRYEVYDTVSGQLKPIVASYALISGKAVFSAKKGYQVAIGKSAEQGTAEKPVFESAWHTILPSLDVGDIDYSITNEEYNAMTALLGANGTRLYDLLEQMASKINERHYIKIRNTNDVTDYSSSYNYFCPLAGGPTVESRRGNLSMTSKTLATFGDRTNQVVTGVLIGKGISQVRVSASVRYLNKETASRTIQTMMQRRRGADLGTSVAFATAANRIGNERLVQSLSTILTVAEGDFICIQGWKDLASADIDVIHSYYATQLVVEAIG